MSKPSAPRPPDPTATANAQTASNRDTAVSNSYLNNVNQVTPYGTVNYDVTGTGPNGLPRWTQTTQESGNQAQLRQLQEQQGIDLGQLGISQTNRVADILGTNYVPRRFDTNSATGGALDINGALGDYNGDVEARTRELAQRGLGDMFDRGQESLDSRLANQGINAGSDAYGAEQQAFQKGKGDAYASAELAARGQAQSDRQQSLSELLGQRQTNLGEAQQQYGYDNTADLAARQNPLNEIIALMSGVQTNPINPGQPNSYNINGTDVAGITQQGFANQMSRYQQESANQNSLLNGLAGLGGAAITRYSDARLKRDISYHHTDANGLRWWTYRYVWDADDAPLQLGVMAQEAPSEAVSSDPDGFLMVDYARLM
jgi:hypothetical protein